MIASCAGKWTRQSLPTHQEQIDTALESLFDDSYAAAADPDALAGE